MVQRKIWSSQTIPLIRYEQEQVAGTFLTTQPITMVSVRCYPRDSSIISCIISMYNATNQVISFLKVLKLILQKIKLRYKEEKMKQ